jgi:hypothetical protein
MIAMIINRMSLSLNDIDWFDESISSSHKCKVIIGMHKWVHNANASKLHRITNGIPTSAVTVYICKRQAEIDFDK